jgi:CcmD family protein
MENAGYFFAAFAVIWAVVFGYVLFLVNKQAKINRQMKTIEQARSREDRS